MREMLMKKSVYTLLSILLCLNIYASENCGYLIPEQDYQCEGSFKAKNIEDLNNYLTSLENNQSTYKDLIVRFDLQGVGLNIFSPCSIKFRKNLNINLTGETCLNSGREVLFNKNTNLSFESLKITANTKIAFRKEIKISGGSLTLDTINKNGESRIHFRKDSEVVIDSLKATAYQKITLGKNIDFKANDSVELYVLDNESEEIQGKVAFFKDGNIEASSITAFSVDKVKFNKNVFVMTEELNVFATECKDRNSAGGTSEACSNPSEPILNEKPFAEMRCFTPRKSNILCYAANSSDSDGTVNLYKFMVEGVVYEQESEWFSLPREAGSYTVSLEVIDNEGGVSNLITSEVEVLPNIAPTADFTCDITEDFKLACDASLSNDPDDTELNYLWKVNGAYYNEVTNIFEIGTASTVDVSLTVSDFFGGSNTISKTFTVRPENIAPVASMICESNSPGSLRCDATGSYDLDGIISKFEFYVGGELIENTTGILEMNDLVGEVYVILIVYDNLNLESEHVTSLISIAEDIRPISNINCTSPKRFQLLCDMTSSQVLHNGYIMSYAIDVDGRYVVSNDGYFDIDLSSGPKTVRGFAFDNLGYESEPAVSYVTVRYNEWPIADFNCTNDVLGTLVCNSLSSDSDDEVLENEWTSEGVTKFGETVTFFYSTGGSKRVTLTSKDQYDGVSAISKDFNVEVNTPPTIVLNCSSNQPLKVYCDASLSSSPKGEDLSYKWKVNGQSISIIDSLLEINLDDTNIANVEVEVTDITGESSTKMTTISTRLPKLDISITCTQIDNYIASCSSNGTSISHGEIESYEWRVDDDVVSDQENIQISLENEGQVNVTLKVTALNSLVEKESSFLVDLLTRDPSNLPSIGEASINLQENKIYNLSQSLNIEVSGVELELDENNVVSSFYLAVNENNISSENISFNNNTITVGHFLENGKNEIEFYLLDKEGRYIKRNFVVFGGNRSLPVEIINSNDDLIEVSLRLIDSPLDIVELNQIGVSDIINNLPSDIDYFLEFKDSQRTRFALVTDDQTEINLSFGDESFPLNSDNLDFSRGTDGWNIEKGSYSIESLFREDIFGTINSGKKLLLSPDSDGIAIIKSTYDISSNESGGTFELPFKFEGSSEGSHYIVRLTNLRTNKSFYKFNSQKNLGNSLDSNVLPEKISLDLDSGDLVEVEILIKDDLGSNESTFIEKTLNFLGINKSYAQNSNNSFFTTYNFKKPKYVTKDISIIDITGTQTGNEIGLFPTGPFPDSFDMEVDGEQAISFGINIEEVINDDSIGELVQEIYICPQTVSDRSSCQTLPLKVSENGDNYISYKSNDINLNFSNFLKICLGTRSSIGFFHSFKCATDSMKRIVFKNVMSLSGLDIVGGENDSEDRYGARDGDKGGADWISVAHINRFRPLLNVSYDFPVNEDEIVLEELNFDDFSGIGQSKDEQPLNEIRHETHDDGITIDARWVKDSEDYSQFHRGQNLNITSIVDLGGLKNILNSVNGIEKVYITSTDLDSLEDNIIKSYVENTCLNDGRMMNGVLDNKSEHTNHFHIKLYDILPNGSFLKHGKQRYDLSSIIETDRDLIRNKLDFIWEPTFNKKVTYTYPKAYKEEGKPIYYVPTEIPNEESTDHPLYMNGNSVEVSNLFPSEMLHLYESVLVPAYGGISIEITALVNDSTGCGAYSITNTFYPTYPKARSIQSSLPQESSVVYELDRNKLDSSRSFGIQFQSDSLARLSIYGDGNLIRTISRKDMIRSLSNNDLIELDKIDQAKVYLVITNDQAITANIDLRVHYFDQELATISQGSIKNLYIRYNGTGSLDRFDFPVLFTNENQVVGSPEILPYDDGDNIEKMITVDARSGDLVAYTSSELIVSEVLVFDPPISVTNITRPRFSSSEENVYSHELFGFLPNRLIDMSAANAGPIKDEYRNNVGAYWNKHICYNNSHSDILDKLVSIIVGFPIVSSTSVEGGRPNVEQLLDNSTKNIEIENECRERRNE